MNLRDLEAACRDRLDDWGKPYLWSTEFLTRALNRAVFEACRRSMLIFDEATPDVCRIDVVAGSRVYALHPRVLAVMSARLDSTAEELGRDPSVLQLDSAHPMWRSLTGTPTGFATLRQFVYLNRTPSEDDALSIRVYRLPLDTEAMSALLDEPPVPEEFHEDLTHWALYKAFRKRDSEAYSIKDSDDELDKFEKAFGKAPSARDANAMRDNPRDATAHPRTLAGTVPRSHWFGHRY